jgi:hypothetical protein
VYCSKSTANELSTKLWYTRSDGVLTLLEELMEWKGYTCAWWSCGAWFGLHMAMKQKNFYGLFFKSIGTEGVCNPFGPKWSLELLYLTSLNLASSPHLRYTSCCNLIWTTTNCPCPTTKDNSLRHYTKFPLSEAGSSLLKMDMRNKQTQVSHVVDLKLEWRQLRMCVFHNWWVLFATYIIMCYSTCLWK